MCLSVVVAIPVLVVIWAFFSIDQRLKEDTQGKQLSAAKLAVSQMVEMEDPLFPNPERLANRILSVYQAAFPDSMVRIYDEFGQILIENTLNSGNGEIITAPVQGITGWEVEVGAAPIVSFRESISTWVWYCLAIAGIAVLLSLLLGFLLYRHLWRLELRSDFLATVSHELKTPVASSRILLETLQSRMEIEGGDKRSQEYLRTLLRENERLHNIIESFLLHSRLEDRKRTFDLQYLDAVESLNNITRGYAARITAAEGSLSMDLPDHPVVIAADREGFDILLTCLIDNAIKYSDNGPDIRVGIREADWGSVVYVMDRGIGIDRANQHKIFEKFFRVDRSLSRRQGGCGLGLSIASHIAEAMNADISVRSQLGKGSTFNLVFKRIAPHKAKAYLGEIKDPSTKKLPDKNPKNIPRPQRTERLDP